MADGSKYYYSHKINQTPTRFFAKSGFALCALTEEATAKGETAYFLTCRCIAELRLYICLRNAMFYVGNIAV